jgi:hypothetical protein
VEHVATGRRRHDHPWHHDSSPRLLARRPSPATSAAFPHAGAAPGESPRAPWPLSASRAVPLASKQLPRPSAADSLRTRLIADHLDRPCLGVWTDTPAIGRRPSAAMLKRDPRKSALSHEGCHFLILPSTSDGRYRSNETSRAGAVLSGSPASSSSGVHSRQEPQRACGRPAGVLFLQAAPRYAPTAHFPALNVHIYREKASTATGIRSRGSAPCRKAIPRVHWGFDRWGTAQNRSDGYPTVSQLSRTPPLPRSPAVTPPEGRQRGYRPLLACRS